MLACVPRAEAAPLREQLAVARVRSGCKCGCGSIDLLIPDEVTARSDQSGAGVLVEGDVLDEHGDAVGGLLLFVDDGRLHDLEVWSVGDPLPLPPLERTRLRLATD